jgi:hypothetical protein
MLKPMSKLKAVLIVALMVAGVGALVTPAVAQRARVPQTGQTTSYAPEDDGDIQAGVEWPTPRFTNRGNGTVRDNLTGLFWLQDVDCGGNNKPWLDALTFANTLASGRCGLRDGSVAGDWRLPHIKELQSLVDFSQESPAFPAGHPFTLARNTVTRLWSPTTRQAGIVNYAWTLDVRDGTTVIRHKTFEPESAWAVRD